MISIYQLKPKFQQLLTPLLVALHKRGITANQITLLSILLSFGIGLAFSAASYERIFFLVLPFGLLLRMALNALDGMMARNYHQQSLKGEVLNEIGDIISDLFIFLPLLLFEKEHFYLIVLFISLSIINEFAGLLAKTTTGIRRYDGPMGKSDRAFMMGLYGVCNFCSPNFHNLSFWFFLTVVLLLTLSTTIRIKKTLDHEA